MRREITILLLALAGALASAGAQKPNILFISVDDWNDWVGAHGNNQAKTPNLDKLAARGVSFTNASQVSVVAFARAWPAAANGTLLYWKASPGVAKRGSSASRRGRAPVL